MSSTWRLSQAKKSLMRLPRFGMAGQISNKDEGSARRRQLQLRHAFARQPKALSPIVDGISGSDGRPSIAMVRLLLALLLHKLYTLRSARMLMKYSDHSLQSGDLSACR